VKQVFIHAIKMNALKTGSLKPSDWILNHFDQQNITSHFHQKQNKIFQHSCKPIHENRLNFLEPVCFEQTLK
jgi:hypothetical protein